MVYSASKAQSQLELSLAQLSPSLLRGIYALKHGVKKLKMQNIFIGVSEKFGMIIGKTGNTFILAVGE